MNRKLSRYLAYPVFPALMLGMFLAVAWNARAEVVEERGTEVLLERLVFDIRWLGAKAGSAQLELFEDGEGRVIRSSARSEDWLSVFYKVRDAAESRLDSEGRPVRFTIRQREGRYRSHKETAFSRAEIVYRDHRKNRETRIDPEGRIMYDVLSGFNALRSRSLEPGTTEYLDICDSGKVYRLEVRILRKEKLVLDDTEVPAVVIQPILRSEGLFKSRGEINIWLTDDERRVPLMVTTEVLIGSVVTRLIEQDHRPPTGSGNPIVSAP